MKISFWKTHGFLGHSLSQLLKTTWRWNKQRKLSKQFFHLNAIIKIWFVVLKVHFREFSALTYFEKFTEIWSEHLVAKIRTNRINTDFFSRIYFGSIKTRWVALKPNPRMNSHFLWLLEILNILRMNKKSDKKNVRWRRNKQRKLLNNSFNLNAIIKILFVALKMSQFQRSADALRQTSEIITWRSAPQTKLISRNLAIALTLRLVRLVLL